MKHGYGCPYHYGPLDYGPEAPNDYGEDCTCEVCLDPRSDDERIRSTMFFMEIKTYPARIRVPLRLRLVEWWRRWRRGKKVQVMLDEVARREDEAMLYGEGVDNSGWLREDY